MSRAHRAAPRSARAQRARNTRAVLPVPDWFETIAVPKVGEVVGPNSQGESFTAVSAEFDPATNSTRVGYCFQTAEPAVPA